MEAKFIDHDLRLLDISFKSPLVDTLEELGYLRRFVAHGSTPYPIFFQLKHIFHIVESIGSARIEGNHTTLADYVDHRISDNDGDSDPMKEIKNIEDSMDYIEQSIKFGDPISEAFIRELHTITVSGLEREGDETPGAYRKKPVRIAKSLHLPPNAIEVPRYMAELVTFINREDAKKYDLMKVAIAHHRFGWVHPFGNGNGRVVRQLTYALLLKFGFNVQEGGRLLNPTAIFCNDRDKYYEMLGIADTGTDENLEQWCIYVLEGMLNELKKVDRLFDYQYLLPNILIPALNYSRERSLITAEERSMLELVLKAEDCTVKAGDFESVLHGFSAPQRTRKVKKLVDNKMLIPKRDNPRMYQPGLANSFLIRGLIKVMGEEGFITQNL